MILKKVQVRIEPVKNTTEKINHDFRIKKVEYLRSNMYHNKFENFSSYSSLDTPDIKIIANNFFHRQKKIKQRMKNLNYKRTDLSSGLIGIITLSPHINVMLMNKELEVDSLNKLFQDALKRVIEKIREICQDRTLHNLYYMIHYDEKTPHLHFLMRNFLEDGKSLFGVVRNSKRMSELQDAVALPFNSIGFERGQKKSKDKHLTVRQMHEVEIKQLISEKSLLKSNIESLNRKIQNKNNILSRMKRDSEYSYLLQYLQSITEKIGLKNNGFIPDDYIVSNKLDELISISEEIILLRTTNKKINSELNIANKIINENQLVLNDSLNFQEENYEISHLRM